MRKILFTACLLIINSIIIAQPVTKPETENGFTTINTVPATPVKNQNMSGTCWCFSTTSLVESQCLKNNLGEFDISEMFIVRNIYIEKAKNYILRNGKAQFSEGGLGHDLIHGIATYGTIPEDIYTGLTEGKKEFNHVMVASLKKYLDNILLDAPVPKNWLTGFLNILNETIPVPPTEFQYKDKRYTPLSFANDVLKFNQDDYVNITSFTHQPFYKPFILQVQDNFSNGLYYNLPLSDMIQLVKESVTNGYSIMWDADVSNPWFMQEKGLAIYPTGNPNHDDITSADAKEADWNATLRQELYERLETQDDHLMHIIGLTKSSKGKKFFKVKNSWGQIGPLNGYISVSEAYFAINTVSLVVPKAALSKVLLEKLKLN